MRRRCRVTLEHGKQDEANVQSDDASDERECDCGGTYGLKEGCQSDYWQSQVLGSCRKLGRQGKTDLASGAGITGRPDYSSEPKQK